MYVCMYMYIYIYIYIHVQITIIVCIYIYIYTYIHTYIHTYTHVCMYIYIYTYIYIYRERERYTYTHIYIHIYIYIYICLFYGGQESVGRLDVTRMLSPSEFAAEGSPGIAYGCALLCGICDELNRRGPPGGRELEPASAQLACFDGGDTRYVVHRDHSDFGVLPFMGDNLPKDPAEL